MQLVSTLAAAAVVSTAAAGPAPPHANHTAPALPASASGSVSVSASASASAQVILNEVNKCPYTIVGGLCQIQCAKPLPQDQSFCLVRDLDAGKSEFAFCAPSQNGHVLTKVKGQFLTGYCSAKASASSEAKAGTGFVQAKADAAAEVFCSWGGAVTGYRVEAKAEAKAEVTTLEASASAKAKAEASVVSCKAHGSCQEKPCQGDECRRNLVITHAKANATASASAGVQHKFEDCKQAPKADDKPEAPKDDNKPEAPKADQPKADKPKADQPQAECNCVKTCVGPDCSVAPPAPAGPASPPLAPKDVEKKTPVSPSNNAVPAAPKEAATRVPVPPAGPNRNGTAPAGVATPGAAGRVSAGVGALAAVVAAALFL